MSILANVESFNTHNEHGVNMVIDDNTELLGFVGYCPYPIEVGKTYPIKLGITVLDDLDIKRVSTPSKGFTRCNNSFSYQIRGILLDRGILDAGIIIEDEVFFNYSFLFNQYVEIRVDRLNVEFVKD